MHKMSRTKLYMTWHNMKQRCSNPNFTQYENYGGRGIKVCREWNESFEVFRNWAFENGYEEGLSIERINVNGNYEPGNCKWITLREQILNRRNTIKTSDGTPVSILAKKNGLSVGTVHKRIKLGWPEKDWFLPQYARFHRKEV